MTKFMGFLMDPPHTLHYKKDSTLALLECVQLRNYAIFYLSPTSLLLNNGRVFAKASPMKLKNNWKSETSPISLGDEQILPIEDFQCIWMRKDPPFNMNYIYLTYLLDLCESSGVLVINPPNALRNFNEKLLPTLFPEKMPPFLVSPIAENIREFKKKHENIVLKPLDGMGGEGIFKITPLSENFEAIVQYLTKNETTPIMIQKFIPDVYIGDYRVLLVNGEIIPYTVLRKPPKGQFIANLAAGGEPVVEPISNTIIDLCAPVQKLLKKHNIYLCGLDIIGQYITEINITCPTGLRQIEDSVNYSVATDLVNHIESIL